MAPSTSAWPISAAAFTAVRCCWRNPGRSRLARTCSARKALPVNAAAEIGQAEVEGAIVGTREFTFVPGKVIPGNYRFNIGTAGSATLVLQTILPPLMIASGASMLRIEGGTHNVHAPPFDFIERTFLPMVSRTGPRFLIGLGRYGFYPAGGGYFEVMIEPCAKLQRVDVLERGKIIARCARALVVNLPKN